MTQHSREDALSDRQFERLLDGARSLDSPWDFEAKLVILLAGKLGLRGGEIAHLSADWIDQEERFIRIPTHDPCSKGKDGDVCGYCRDRAKEHKETHNMDLEAAKAWIREELDVDLPEEKVSELASEKREEHNITLGQALERRWRPKTENGARSIPYDIDVRVEMTIEEFVDRYDIFPKARVAVNRRVSEAAEAAGLEVNIYPHALRATAATNMALMDISAASLSAIMGWSDISTARAYIRASDANAARELRAKHR